MVGAMVTFDVENIEYATFVRFKPRHGIVGEGDGVVVSLVADGFLVVVQHKLHVAHRCAQRQL